jgi:hypothetical protein
VPQKEVTIRLNDKVWFNSELRKEIRKRDRLRKLARRSNSDFNINKYKKQRNHVNNLKTELNQTLSFSLIVTSFWGTQFLIISINVFVNV